MTPRRSTGHRAVPRRGAVLPALALAVALAVPGSARAQQAATASEAPRTVELSLDEALLRAEASSPRLDELRALLDAARADVAGAHAERLPEIGLQAAYTRLSDVPEFRVRIGDTLRTIFPNIPDDWLLRATASLPLYTGGRLEGQIRSADNALAAGRQQLRADRAAVALTTTVAWWGLVLAERREAVLAEALTSFEAHLQDARNRLRVGLAAPNEPLAVQVELDRARLDRVRGANERAVAEDTLATLLDMPPGTHIVAAATAPEAPEAPEGTEALVDEALASRPEGEALRQRVAEADSRLAVASAAGKPQVALSASFDYANPNRRLLPPEADFDTSWQVGVGVSFNVFDGGRRSSLQESAAARARAARERVTELERSIRGEVVGAVYELRTAVASIDVSEQAVKAAEESLRVAVDRHREGVAPSSERLDAETALLRARQRLVDAQVSAIVARARLDHAVGRTAPPEPAHAQEGR